MLTSHLLKVRSNAIKASDDYLEFPSETIKSDVNHLCVAKGPKGNQVIFCVTNTSSGGSSYDFSLDGFEADDKIIEVIGCKTVSADATGSFPVYMGSGEPKVYVLASSLNGTGLCSTNEVDAPKEDKSSGSALGVASGMVVAAVVGWAAVLLV